MPVPKTSPKKFATLEEMYAAIPQTACKGLCWEACVAGVRAHPQEMERIEQLAGKRPIAALTSRNTASSLCKYLTVDRRCAVYNARPMICRAYGATEDPRIACEHGCCEEPLSVEATHEIMVAYVLSGPARYEDVPRIR